MSTITKVIPSASTDGAPVKIIPTATAGQLFHTAAASPAIDEVYMYLTNTSAADVEVTVELGGPTAPDFNVKFVVPAKDTILALPGTPLTNAKTVKAFAASANVINMFGYVNRIT